VPRISLWPIVALALFIAIWAVSTIYLALALAICIGALMLVYWAFTQLPERLGGSGGRSGRDAAPPKRRGSR
jgi:hypothetical protein